MSWVQRGTMTVLAKASSNLLETKLEECTLVRNPEDKSPFWIDGRVILKIIEYEVGRSCSTNGGDEECV
jgi:hypothetical protein